MQPRRPLPVAGRSAQRWVAELDGLSCFLADLFIDDSGSGQAQAISLLQPPWPQGRALAPRPICLLGPDGVWGGGLPPGAFLGGPGWAGPGRFGPAAAPAPGRGTNPDLLWLEPT